MHALTRSCALWCGLVLIAVTSSSGVANDRGPNIPPGKGEQCVAETDFMRRNHMDLIIHQRDETVIRGIREEPFSLVECVACHARKDDTNDYVRIDAKGEFCAACHEFVAAKIDCFSCHAAVPDAGREERAQWKPNRHLLEQIQHLAKTNSGTLEQGDKSADNGHSTNTN